MLDKETFAVLSDFFTNLSAGWIATGIIISPFLEKKRKINLLILTTNFILAILALEIAIFLRKL